MLRNSIKEENHLSATKIIDEMEQEFSNLKEINDNHYQSNEKEITKMLHEIDIKIAETYQVDLESCENFPDTEMMKEFDEPLQEAIKKELEEIKNPVKNFTS